jgi:hypothetical protein
LAPEIRARIFQYILNDLNLQITSGVSRDTYEIEKASSCGCDKPSRKFGWRRDVASAVKKIAIALGPELKDEFLSVFFRKRPVKFACLCDLSYRLNRHANLFNHLQSVDLHWCGAVSDKAFEQLAKCPNLKKLRLMVSNLTFVNVSRREGMLRTYFGDGTKLTKLSEVLGMDELLKLRGLESVCVYYEPKVDRQKSAHKADTQSLQRMLQEVLTQPHTVSTFGRSKCKESQLTPRYRSRIVDIESQALCGSKDAERPVGHSRDE